MKTQPEQQGNVPQKSIKVSLGIPLEYRKYKQKLICKNFIEAVLNIA